MTIDTIKPPMQTQPVPKKDNLIVIFSAGDFEFRKPVSCVDIFGNEVKIYDRRLKIITLEDGSESTDLYIK